MLYLVLAVNIDVICNKNMEKFNTFLDQAIDYIWMYGPKILLAVIILFIGFKVIKKLVKLIGLALEKGGISQNIRPFLMSIIDVLLKIALLLIAAAIVGIELSIFTAIIAASVFAIGMALQGSLGNFASGLIVLSLKPYKVNDWIQIEDKFGKVEEIGVFNTKIVTPGKKTMIIPNSKITGEVVTNYSEKGVIRLEIDVTMPYEESFPKVKSIIVNSLKTVNNILDTPVPEIGIESFDSHNVQITVRPYANPDNYWQVTFDTHEAIKKAFSDNAIKVAYSEGVEFGSIGE